MLKDLEISPAFYMLDFMSNLCEFNWYDKYLMFIFWF